MTFSLLLQYLTTILWLVIWSNVTWWCRALFVFNCVDPSYRMNSYIATSSHWTQSCNEHINTHKWTRTRDHMCPAWVALATAPREQFQIKYLAQGHSITILCSAIHCFRHNFTDHSTLSVYLLENILLTSMLNWHHSHHQF